MVAGAGHRGRAVPGHDGAQRRGGGYARPVGRDRAAADRRRPVRALLRRLRANALPLGMLALLAFAAALLLTATPHLANRHTDHGLRDRIGALSHRTRDVTYLLRERVGDGPIGPQLSDAAGRLADLRRDLPAPLRGRLASAWYSSQIGPD